MKDNKREILVINPGSTSTKLSYYLDDKCVFTEDVFHDSSVLKTYKTINDQLDYRMSVVKAFLINKKIDAKTLDAIIARGGGCYSCIGGIYDINEKLVKDTKDGKGGLYHSSNLGVQMAKELSKGSRAALLMMNPPVVDELDDVARVTGVSGIHRKAISHALNLKATARRHAKIMNKEYEECNFIVCHIDGGISITAHHLGKMIDGNDAGGGEGPFTPTRMGSLAVTDMNKYLKDKTKAEIKSLCSQTGGLSNYFGTSNSDKIHELVEKKDPKAMIIWDAMIYQICKYIGSMSTVLKGDVDAIILTGGLLRFKDISDQIKDRCSWIAPIAIYKGEMEQETMALSALEVLNGKKTMRYLGKPVWTKFDWE